LRADREKRIHDLFQANSASVLTYFARRVTPLEDAADLLSETLVVVCRRPRAIPEHPEDARMWLFGIARNTMRNYERGKRRGSALADQLRSTLTGVPNEDSTVEVIDVRAAIASLRPEDRELVRLIYWDGFSTEPAAEIIGISGSTARGRMQRIKSIMRERVGAFDGAERA
jgi:RNA polymerase sigma-70 factor (ECF subfamily)